jgi:hypothetical protein
MVDQLSSAKLARAGFVAVLREVAGLKVLLSWLKRVRVVKSTARALQLENGNSSVLFC